MTNPPALASNTNASCCHHSWEKLATMVPWTKPGCATRTAIVTMKLLRHRPTSRANKLHFAGQLTPRLNRSQTREQVLPWKSLNCHGLIKLFFLHLETFEQRRFYGGIAVARGYPPFWIYIMQRMRRNDRMVARQSICCSITREPSRVDHHAWIITRGPSRVDRW